MNFIERITDACKKTAEINTLQVNLGKLCNLTCTHCHVNAGPGKTEVMINETIYEVLEVLKKN